jgi:acetylornithine/succinyldiaminopimelate/putrescine aminotransferase
MHASTFGGNPMAAAAGIATIETIEEEGLLENVKMLAALFENRFSDLRTECQWIKEIRVAGMMIGIELDVDGGNVVQQCLEQKLLVNCTQGNVIRLLPAMNLTEQQANAGVDVLSGVLRQLEV